MHDTTKEYSKLPRLVDKDSEIIRGLFANIENSMNKIHTDIEAIKELVEEKCKLR